MEKAQAEDYLSSLIDKTLRVTTTDTRMFLGQFKCTDSDRNIILAHTFEYSLPPPPNGLPESQTDGQTESTLEEAGKGKVVMDMTSRFLGLVVVPGEHVVKIEVEEFESQIRGKRNSGSG